MTKGVFAASPCDFTGTVYQMMRPNGYYTVTWGKVLALEAEMALRLPRGLVWWTNQRYRSRHQKTD